MTTETNKPPTPSPSDNQSTLALLKQILNTSQIRSGQYQTPWSSEQEPTVLAVWMRTLAANGIQIDRLHGLMKSTHESRPSREQGRPVTLDHVIHCHRQKQAGLVWNCRFEKWVDAEGDFFAPPTPGER